MVDGSIKMVDGSFKGLPPALGPTPLAELGALGWSLRDDRLPTPVAVLHDAAIDHNRAWIRRFCARAGVSFAPHGKTTMSPELFALQMEDGAWGLTVATTHQARVARGCGISNILLANQVVTRSEREWVATNGVVTLVDDVTTARRASGPALLEVGFVGGRGGCRTVESAIAVARAAAEAGRPLVGVETFEGLIPGNTPEVRDSNVRLFLDTLVEIAERVSPWLTTLPGEDRPILTAGGSIFPDLAARHISQEVGFRPIVRSGCYLTGDHGIYAAASLRMAERDPAIGLLRPALEVWAAVVSRPERGRAILGAGKRDIGIDAGFPVALRTIDRTFDARVAQVDDQHVHLVIPEDDPLQIGERVALGITHPCTTFDRWSVILRVNEALDVTGAVHTRFG
jgi:D-serine dehydratase